MFAAEDGFLKEGGKPQLEYSASSAVMRIVCRGALAQGWLLQRRGGKTNIGGAELSYHQGSSSLTRELAFV